MSRPDQLTTEELRAVCWAIRDSCQDANPAHGWTDGERNHLLCAEEKLLERLAYRKAHARSGTAPDPARTR